MVEEVLLENAPLIEVIAEIRWELVPLGLVPGAAIDPYFDLASKTLTGKLRELGFGIVEPQVPPEVPKELVAGNPINRYRTEQGAWPLYQHGPGVFTCNITPPYKGWTGFRPTLLSGLRALIESYPVPQETLKISSLALRYVDAFTEAHGRNEAESFLRESLKININLPDRFSADLNLKSPTSIALDMKFGATRLADTALGLKIQPAQREGVEATLLELNAASSMARKSEADEIIEWFDSAKGVVGDAFRALTDGFRPRMGPETVVQVQ